MEGSDFSTRPGTIRMRLWQRPAASGSKGRYAARNLALSLAALLWWGVSANGAAPAPAAAKVDFARDIRPILAHHCAACHGFDPKARKARLRLDVRDSALARKAIVPGNAAA